MAEPSIHHLEILRQRAQVAVAVGGHHDEVLDADAESRALDARLDRDDVALEESSSRRREPRPFVDLEPDPCPSPCPAVAVTGLGDHLASDGVDLLPAGLRRSASRAAGWARNQLVDLPCVACPRRSRTCGCSPSSSRRAATRRPATSSPGPIPARRAPRGAARRFRRWPGREGRPRELADASFDRPATRVRCDRRVAPRSSTRRRLAELGSGGDPLQLLGLLDRPKLLDEVTRGDEFHILRGGGLEPASPGR